ncbi:hypothetical protein C8R44DRAFT_741605 [Mycena epipterygia]|nr:hypothetical protein C8R44DRAFT_741605 [Mycena epipterygia]
MSTVSIGEFRAVALIFGPRMIGTAVDLVLQGVLWCELANYYSWYGDDKKTLKIIVGVLALGTCLKSIQAFAVIWIKFVVHFNDFEGAMILSFTARWESGNAVMSYCCFRLWVISQKWYVAAPIQFLAVFGFLSIVVPHDEEKYAGCFRQYRAQGQAGCVYPLRAAKVAVPVTLPNTYTVALDGTLASTSLLSSACAFSKIHGFFYQASVREGASEPLAVPKARHKNFHFGRFLILAKELLLSPRALIRLT